MNSRLRPAFTLTLVLALSLTGACRSIYDSPEDFSKSRKRIEQGKGSEEIQVMLKDLKEIPPQYQKNVVENIDAVKDPNGQKALITLLENPLIKEDTTRQDVAHRLMARDESGTPEALLVACQNRPNLVTAETIRYFGDKRYKPAIPLIKKQIEQKKFLKEDIAALGNMQDESADLLVLSLAVGQDEEIRKLALENTSRTEIETVQKQAVPTCETIVRAHATEPREILLLAIDMLTRWGDPNTSFEELRNVYESTGDEDLRDRALTALAKLRNTTPEIIERDLNSALVNADAALEFIRNRERGVDTPRTDRTTRTETVATTTKTTERTNKTTRTTTKNAEQKTADQRTSKKIGPAPRYSDNYRAQLNARFAEVFTEDLGRSLQSQIDNALKAYAESTQPKGRFIQRSYRKQFGADETQVRGLLEKGLNHPGSLSAVVRNIIDEYATEKMQGYALAELFSLKRWQAEKILELIRANRL